MKRFTGIFCGLVAVMAMVFVAGCKQETKTQYTVTYHAGAFSSNPASVTVDEGTALSDEYLPELSSSEADFLGWTVDSPRLDNPYASDLMPANGFKVTKDVTLYAEWTAYITLNANGGTINGSSVVYKHPFKYFAYSADYSETVLPSADSIGLIKDGYTLLCWSTVADGKGKMYDLVKTYYYTSYSDGLKDVDVLYAVWEENNSKKKIATRDNLESVLKSLDDGDTLVLVFDGISTKEAELVNSYLKDASKLIHLDARYVNFNLNSYGAGNYNISSIFNNCISIKTAKIGRDATSNPQSLFPGFSGCNNLESVELMYNKNFRDQISVNLYDFSDNCKTFTFGTNITEISTNSRVTSLTSVSFEDTKNWYASSKSSLSDAKEADDLVAVDVSNPSVNAQNLRYANGKIEWNYLYKVSE